MTTELSHEQRSELKRHADGPIEVVDPETKKVYVIIDGELYKRLKPLFADGAFDIRETYTAQSAAAGAAGWDDPEMDVYDDYVKMSSLPCRTS
jgi:hypothetical protein